jgi:hypothetical protein
MKKYTVFICLLIVIVPGYCQETSIWKRTDKSIGFSAGGSRFHVLNYTESVTYPSAEFSMSFDLEYTLNRKLLIGSGLNYHFKLKRSPYFYLDEFGNPSTMEATAIKSLDEASSISSQHALSIPFLVGYYSEVTKVLVKTGYLNRFWIPNGRRVLGYDSNYEGGVILSFSKKFSPSLRAELELYLGVIDIYHGTIYRQSGVFNPKVVNQYIQIGLSKELK